MTLESKDPLYSVSQWDESVSEGGPDEERETFSSETTQSLYFAYIKFPLWYPSMQQNRMQQNPKL